jgi:hypothetical protein
VRYFCLLLLLFVIPRLGEGQHRKRILVVTDESARLPVSSDFEQPSELEDWFFLIADTSMDYLKLRTAIHDAVLKVNIDFDSLGRVFDPTTDSLMIPLDSDDEIYRGQYFPRRFASSQFSIEYLDAYQTLASKNTFAIVAGIFEKEKDARRYAKQFRKIFPNIYILKSRIYLGCMH